MAFDSVFDRSIVELKEFQHGESLPIDIAKFNNPIRAIKTITGGVAPARQLAPQRKATAGGTRRQARITDLDGGPDGMKCILDPPGTGETIIVIRPWFLRRTPWDGQTRGDSTITYDDPPAAGNFMRRVVTTIPEAVTIEIHAITPDYAVGDFIEVSPIEPAALEASGTAVPAGGPLWLDRNVDSREWARGVTFEEIP